MLWPIPRLWNGATLAGATVLAVVCAGAAVGALAVTVTATRVEAQASPYIPLDDPRLPLLEHLIARGDIPDPSPMVRPFRQLDAARALARGDTDAPGSTGTLIRDLRVQFVPSSQAGAWQAGARAGGQAYTSVRRDVLHPLNPDGARPYAEFSGNVTAGAVVVASRLAAEPRLPDDPEWPGRRDLTLAWRAIDGYVSAQFKYGSVFYGQLDRNWGPVGLSGIGLSNYGYPQVDAGFTVEVGGFRLGALARTLWDDQASDGTPIHRYFFAHRIGVRLSDRVEVGVWETAVVAGPDRVFDGRYRNPITLLLFTNQYGLGADGNVMLGVDGQWRAGRRVTLQAQVGLDDFQYENPTGSTRYPNRWALTVSAFGALGPSASWRTFYTQASSLAFRTLNASENFTDRGVGIGRNYDDYDQLSMFLGLPVRNRWLLSPEFTLLRQGEGQINDPFPPTPEEAGQIPSLFIGTMERTWRFALGVAGRGGPLDLYANGGFNHVVNADHVRGSTANRFEGRVQATLGFTSTGVFR